MNSHGRQLAAQYGQAWQCSICSENAAETTVGTSEIEQTMGIRAKMADIIHDQILYIIFAKHRFGWEIFTAVSGRRLYSFVLRIVDGCERVEVRHRRYHNGELPTDPFQVYLKQEETKLTPFDENAVEVNQIEGSGLDMVDITTLLLSGRPYDAVGQYVVPFTLQACFGTSVTVPLSLHEFMEIGLGEGQFTLQHVTDQRSEGYTRKEGFTRHFLKDAKQDDHAFANAGGDFAWCAIVIDTLESMGIVPVDKTNEFIRYAERKSQQLAHRVANGPPFPCFRSESTLIEDEPPLLEAPGINLPENLDMLKNKALRNFSEPLSMIRIIEREHAVELRTVSKAKARAESEPETTPETELR